jgi:DNA-binding beta-propeller fold protein YncE
LNPQDVAIAPNGNVAVADSGNERVQVLSPSGEVVAVISSESLKIAPFSFVPRSVAFDAKGQLYIVDEFSSRIWVMDEKGAVVRSFGGFGTGVTQFTYPCGIFVDAAGKIYVTDRSRIQVF